MSLSTPRGFKVYRYKNHHFVVKLPASSDPSPHHSGLEVVNEIPSDPEELRQYARTRRHKLRGLLRKDEAEAVKLGYNIGTGGFEDYHRSDWVYEIDLVELVFYLNGQALFDLENMPRGDHFIDSIDSAYDHYGHRSWAASMPSRYRLGLPEPPEVDDEALEGYSQSMLVVEVHTIIYKQNLHPSLLETTRIVVLQQLIGHFLHDAPEIVHPLCFMEHARDREDITDRTFTLAMSFLMLGTQTTLAYRVRLNFPVARDLGERKSEVHWLRDDLSVLVTTHLDDERNLCAAVMEIVHATTRQANAPSEIFGIIFSIFHICLVRVSKYGNTVTIRHTECLPFLPSPYATDPSTQGITALSRLMQHLQTDPLGDLIRTTEEDPLAYSRGRTQNDFSSSSATCSWIPLPTELCLEIAFRLPYPELLTFAAFPSDSWHPTATCRDVVTDVFLYPHLEANFFSRRPLWRIAGVCQNPLIIPDKSLDNESILKGEGIPRLRVAEFHLADDPRSSWKSKPTDHRLVLGKVSMCDQPGVRRVDNGIMDAKLCTGLQWLPYAIYEVDEVKAQASRRPFPKI